MMYIRSNNEIDNKRINVSKIANDLLFRIESLI